MHDPRMKEQLALARDAGTKAMAKDFFAETPGSGGPTEAGEVPEASDGQPAAEIPPELAALSPEQLEELLALLAQQGGGEVPPEGV
jgi:hypothetical protein